MNNIIPTSDWHTFYCWNSNIRLSDRQKYEANHHLVNCADHQHTLFSPARLAEGIVSTDWCQHLDSFSRSIEKIQSEKRHKKRIASGRVSGRWLNFNPISHSLGMIWNLRILIERILKIIAWLQMNAHVLINSWKIFSHKIVISIGFRAANSDHSQ